MLLNHWKCGQSHKFHYASDKYPTMQEFEWVQDLYFILTIAYYYTIHILHN